MKKAEVGAKVSPHLAALTFNNTACYYKAIGKHRVALKFLEEALTVEKGTEKPRHVSDILLNICAVLSKLGKHKDALDAILNSVYLLQEQILSVSLGHLFDIERLEFEDETGGEKLGTMAWEYLRGYERSEIESLVDAPKSDKRAYVLERIGVLIVAYHNMGVEFEHLKLKREALGVFEKACDLSAIYKGEPADLTVKLRKISSDLREQLGLSPRSGTCFKMSQKRDSETNFTSNFAEKTHQSELQECPVSKLREVFPASNPEDSDQNESDLGGSPTSERQVSSKCTTGKSQKSKGKNCQIMSVPGYPKQFRISEIKKNGIKSHSNTTAKEEQTEAVSGTAAVQEASIEEPVLKHAGKASVRFADVNDVNPVNPLPGNMNLISVGSIQNTLDHRQVEANRNTQIATSNKLRKYEGLSTPFINNDSSKERIIVEAKKRATDLPKGRITFSSQQVENLRPSQKSLLGPNSQVKRVVFKTAVEPSEEKSPVAEKMDLEFKIPALPKAKAEIQPPKLASFRLPAPSQEDILSLESASREVTKSSNSADRSQRRSNSALSEDSRSEMIPRESRVTNSANDFSLRNKQGAEVEQDWQEDVSNSEIDDN